MIILTANNITKSYGVEDILINLSFHINQGDRIGIIGKNGAGKTTLLNILAGRTQPSHGEFFINGQTRVGYLRQSDNFSSEKSVYDEMLSIFQPLIDMETEMSELSHYISEKSSKGENVEELLHQYDDLHETYKNQNGFSYKSEIHGILNSMAFSDDFFQKKISLLSGGERTRLALASLLLKKPDLLLLDEPTNHLDIGTIKWLEQYLKTYSGTLVVISHDRYFLDQIVNRIFEIENHKINIYEGNYTSYVEKKRFKEADQLKKYENQQKELQKQEEIIRRFKQHGTEKLAKRAQSREKRLAHVEVLERPEVSTGKMKLGFKETFKSGNDVLVARELSKSFGFGENKRQLFENISLDIKRGEKICLVGPNGCGKTTLLKILMDSMEPNTGYVKAGHNVIFGYYDQEQKILNGKSTVLDEIHSEHTLYSETELRNKLGRFLFRGNSVFQEVSSLSGGEKARLALLKLMMSEANVLIMDEPTNHLDIDSKEVFEDALLEFPGTVIVVSHDRYFLNKVPEKILELNPEGIITYLGGYDYYMEKKQSLGSGKSYLQELSKTGEEKEFTGKELNKEARRLEKEKQMEERRKERALKKKEEEIAQLEEKISELEAAMCAEENLTDHKKLLELEKEFTESKSLLEEKLESWILEAE